MSPSEDLVRLFPRAVSLVDYLYKKHEPEKGDSWRTCDAAFLESKLNEEYDEVDPDAPAVVEAAELADLALVALMLLERRLSQV